MGALDDLLRPWHTEIMGRAARVYLPWKSATDIELGSAAVVPQGSEGHAGDCGDDVAPRAEAREQGLRSNLALHLAHNGAFSLFTCLDTPAVG